MAEQVFAHLVRTDKRGGELLPRSECRRWRLVVTVGGRRTARRFSGTEEEALAALDGLRCMTFAQWAELWRYRRAASFAKSPATLEGDRHRLAAVAPLLDMPLEYVTADDVRMVYMQLSRGCTPSGKPYSPKSIQDVHKTLTTLFGDAVRDGLLDRSPMDSVDCPKAPRKRYKVIGPEQMDALLAALDFSKGAERAVALCCACGLRRREAVELEWRDLAEELEIVDAKTAAGSRLVPVPQRVLERLEPHRSDGRVSGLANPHSLTDFWAKRRAGFGLDCTLHDLRRSWASRLASAGTPMHVLKQLGGWSDDGIVLQVYLHVLDGQRRAAVDAAFGG